MGDGSCDDRVNPRAGPDESKTASTRCPHCGSRNIVLMEHCAYCDQYYCRECTRTRHIEAPRRSQGVIVTGHGYEDEQIPTCFPHKYRTMYCRECPVDGLCQWLWKRVLQRPECFGDLDCEGHRKIMCIDTSDCRRANGQLSDRGTEDKHTYHCTGDYVTVR